MHKFLLLALLPLPMAALGQQVVTITQQQCVWRAGDNPAWAAPVLDESAWRPFSEWSPLNSPTRFWVRCHQDLNSLRGLAHPAVQVNLYAAWHLFLDGHPLGSAGNLGNGNFSVDSMRTLPMQPPQIPTGPSTFAFRIAQRSLISSSTPVLSLLMSRPELRAGDQQILDGLRARRVVSQAALFAEPALCYLIIAVIAIMLLGLYFYDRSRPELLLLSLICLCYAVLRLNEFCAAAMLGYSISLCLWLVLVGNLGASALHAPFFFALARRRMPLVFWIVTVALLLVYIPSLIDVLIAIRQPAWQGPMNLRIVNPSGLALHMALCFAPFVAFWPWSRIGSRMRPLAVLCMLWQAVDLIWFCAVLTENISPGAQNFFAKWGLTLLDFRAILTACVLAALLGLLFREQRQITQERALLAGEMQAASEIQHMLAPAAIDTVPGLRIEVAFHPMREVGGDFYHCRVLPNSLQRLLVGDVSGKGAAAAMAATLLLGAASGRDSDSPADLLSQLNRVLCRSRVGGFATCLCADIAENGAITIANAGHLAPYCNGQEIGVDSGLPLGIAADADHSQIILRLAPGDRLTFVSDGVVEARNPHGELFGFDRTRQISTQTAEAIAQAAQVFGQEDDITVLTVRFQGESHSEASSIGLHLEGLTAES